LGSGITGLSEKSLPRWLNKTQLKNFNFANSMKPNTYKDIVTSAKITVLALFWGGIFGLTGLAFSMFLPFMNTPLIFGGIGMWLAFGLNASLLLPAIHCAYAFIIIRFRLEGIIFIILIHYLSMTVALTLVALTNVAPELWHSIRMVYDPRYYGGSPLDIILMPMMYAMTIGFSAPHNVFLLSLLFRKVRKVLSLEHDACQFKKMDDTELLPNEDATAIRT